MTREGRRGRRIRSGGLDKDVAYREAPSRDRGHHLRRRKQTNAHSQARGPVGRRRHRLGGVHRWRCLSFGERRWQRRRRLPAWSACRGTTTSSRAGRPLTSRTSKDAVEAARRYLHRGIDARHDAAQQLTDVENLINQGINVLILLAKDTTTIGPALETAANAGVPVIAYDRLIEDPERPLHHLRQRRRRRGRGARPCSKRCRPARTS